MAEVALFVERWLALPIYRPGLHVLRKWPDQGAAACNQKRWARNQRGFVRKLAKGGMDEFESGSSLMN
ncbi:hypothetical protein P4133_08345 [Pseudomonas aeruginosa]|nr:hypothetical protein [Pseudomonas aeruginosa]